MPLYPLSQIQMNNLWLLESKQEKSWTMSAFSSSFYTTDVGFGLLCLKQPSMQGFSILLKAISKSRLFSFLLLCGKLYQESLASFLNQHCCTPVTKEIIKIYCQGVYNCSWSPSFVQKLLPRVAMPSQTDS